MTVLCILMCTDLLTPCMQVAFGTDFTQQLSVQKDLKLAKGNGTLTYLVDFTLKGVQKSILFPGYRVSLRLITRQLLRYLDLLHYYVYFCSSITIH